MMSFNNPTLSENLEQICPSELEIKETTDSQNLLYTKINSLGETKGEKYIF